MKYVELAKGGVSDRAYIVSLTDLTVRIEDAQRRGIELYRSLYEYDEEILEHMKCKKSVTGYRGKYYLKKLLFDIDKGSDNDEGVIHRVKLFIETLYEWKLDEENIQIWYSGRGFHITTPDIFGFEPSNTLPKEVAATIGKYFPQVDRIYDGSRIIRAEGTINNKSGLYKIPISLEELGVDTIKTLAQTFRANPYLDPNTCSISNRDLILVKREAKTIQFDEPSRVVTCIQRISREGSEVNLEGTSQRFRHKKLLRLISSWMRSGRTKEESIILGTSWATTIEPYEVQRLVEDVYRIRYRFGCDDEILCAFCSKGCIHYKKKDYTDAAVESAQDMEKSYAQYVRTNFEGRILDLQFPLTLKVPYKIHPGEFVVIEGDTGTGKSTLLQNILIGTMMPSLVISTENDGHLTYRRNVQIKYSLTEQEVIDHYIHNDNSYSQGLSHINMINDTTSLETIKRLVSQFEPKIVAIDVLEDIDAEGKEKNSYEHLGKIGLGLKALAKNMGVIVLAVHHLSKNAAVDDKGKQKEIHVHSGKGNSAIEQKADRVIGIQGDINTPHRRINSLKTRDGSGFNTAGYFNWKFMQYVSTDLRRYN